MVTSPCLGQKGAAAAINAQLHCHRYACSGCTLFGNKYILSQLHADPNLLAMSQMTMTAVFGAIKMYGPYVVGSGPMQESPLSTQPTRTFVLDMAIVGIMRVVTVVLGLVSLKYVAVSFTETVKSSAPFFTKATERAGSGRGMLLSLSSLSGARR